MKTIKIKFSGMWGGFNEKDNFIYNILKRKYNVVFSNNPDYLFYSVFSKDYLKYNCVRIFYTAENIAPDFNICDYAIGFHFIDFEDRYIRYPLYLQDQYSKDLVLAENKHKIVDKTLSEKKAFCSFVYTNADAAPCREIFFQKLSNYKKVNSGGRFLNNIGKIVEDKLAFQKQHKFSLAFENSSSPGYTTEKLVQAFSAGTVPIYWGDPTVSRIFNEKAFINCKNLDRDGNIIEIESIINRIIEIDNDDNLYRSMLEAPIFNYNYSTCEQKRLLEAFLDNIFEQELENAYRRNRYYWGERYERKQKIGNSFYHICRKGIPIRDFICNISNNTRRK